MFHMSEPLHARMSGLFARRASGRDGAFGALGGRLASPRGVAGWALSASLAWGVLVGGYAIGYLTVASEAQVRGMLFLDGLFLLIALFLPIGLFWLSARLAGALREQREIVSALAERTAPLLVELEATRRSVAAGGGGAAEAFEQTIRTMIQTRQRAETDIAEGLTAVAQGQARLQATMAALLENLVIDPIGPLAEEPPPAAPREAEPARPAALWRPVAEEHADEPLLPLLSDTATDPERPAWPDLVKALDFPRDDQDFEGFRALQAVLRYHPLAQMLQSAEDVLTLLSQEGVYMEDLKVETGDPVHWRRFMAGERGAGVASVGGIVDAQALDLTRSLLKSDPIFRDTALFFQRRFDRVLQDFAREAGDAEITDVANTRSGRAFMLLARLNGAFD
jgi:hypothetical protein